MSRRFVLGKRILINYPIGGRLRILTFLSDEFNERNQSDIGPGRHWVVEQNAAMPYGALVPQYEWPSCSQAHPICKIILGLVW
jgi:hypothetical protein